MKREERKEQNYVDYPASADIFLNSVTDKIYDDFESRSCLNCKHSYMKTMCDNYYCKLNVLSTDNENVDIVKCNKWESKQ